MRTNQNSLRSDSVICTHFVFVSCHEVPTACADCFRRLCVPLRLTVLPVTKSLQERVLPVQNNLHEPSHFPKIGRSEMRTNRVSEQSELAICAHCHERITIFVKVQVRKPFCTGGRPFCRDNYSFISAAAPVFLLPAPSSGGTSPASLFLQLPSPPEPCSGTAHL